MNREDQERGDRKIPAPSHFTLRELIARLEEELRSGSSSE